MKYKTENEFCIEVTKRLLGICIYDDSKYLCVPEIPNGFFSNDRTDMLIINMSRKEMFGIEYKLNDIKKLEKQLIMNCRIKLIGIINKKIPIEEFNMFQRIFGYTGEDYQIEILHSRIINPMCNISSSDIWTSIYDSGWARFYYFAFKNDESSLNGGLKQSNRKSLFYYYIQAVKNLQKDYDNKLDFLIVNSILDIGYSVNVAKKYYNRAMREIKSE